METIYNRTIWWKSMNTFPQTLNIAGCLGLGYIFLIDFHAFS